MKRVNWNDLSGISLYQTFSSSGLLKAGFEHLLNRLVAFGSVFDMNSSKDLTGHLSPALGIAYIAPYCFYFNILLKKCLQCNCLGMSMFTFEKSSS